MEAGVTLPGLAHTGCGSSQCRQCLHLSPIPTCLHSPLSPDPHPTPFYPQEVPLRKEQHSIPGSTQENYCRHFTPIDIEHRRLREWLPVLETLREALSETSGLLLAPDTECTQGGSPAPPAGEGPKKAHPGPGDQDWLPSPVSWETLVPPKKLQ